MALGVRSARLCINFAPGEKPPLMPARADCLEILRFHYSDVRNTHPLGALAAAFWYFHSFLYSIYFCWMKEYMKAWEITVLFSSQFFPEAFLKCSSQWVWHAQLPEPFVSEVVWFYRVSLCLPPGLEIPRGQKVHSSFLFVYSVPSTVPGT